MAGSFPIYLDHNATTPVDARVFEAMRPYFTEMFGNAASKGHVAGMTARVAVENARRQVARILRAHDTDIVWTSGATESNNLAIKGVADAMKSHGRHLVTQTTEHKAVLDPCKRLAREGFDVTWIQPDPLGRISAQQIREAIRPGETILVSIMAANNEIGTTNPIRDIGRICREAGVLFHTDATQVIGKLPVDVDADQIDLLSLTAHKFYGPKGCGALYVRRNNPRLKLTPLFDGGGHEGGFRSGTLNVPGIVGLGAACDLALQELPKESPRQALLRDRLEMGIFAQIEGVSINGDPDHRLPHVSNLSFAHTDGQRLLEDLNHDLCVSSGSACTSAVKEPSYVLRAIGVQDELAYSSVRFSLGRCTTEQAIDEAIRVVVNAVRANRVVGVPA